MYLGAPYAFMKLVYKLYIKKDAFVVARLELFVGSNQQSVSFVRAIYDWEVDMFASFFNLLYAIR